MTNPFLETKFHIPSRRTGDVSRSRLFDTLQSGLRENRKLTLVSAPAGYGKTTLVKDWISSLSNDHRVAWLSLDDGDNDPARFLGYWIEAFRRMDKSLGQDLQSMVGIMQTPSTPVIMDALINELVDIDTSLLVILDDYHVITNPILHNSIEYFIEHQPQYVHIVIITREDPPLPLARLRARRKMTEIRAHDLRFTLEEAGQFFNQSMLLNLEEAAVRNLEARTEGWPAGLQLAALAMKSVTDQQEFLLNFSGSHRYVIDYLLDEVLKQQTPQIRDFLGKTSILKRFNAELCQTITGNPKSASILNEMERSNLFLIPLDDRRGWYRYHHLFADVLRVGLSAEVEHEVRKCAADWFEKHELYAEAIPYWLAVSDAQQAGKLIGRLAVDFIKKGELRTLQDWLDVLPEEVINTNLDLASYKALALLLTGQLNKAQAYLTQILTLPGNQGNTAWKGQLMAIQSWIAMTNGEARSGEIAAEALEQLGRMDSFFRLLSLIALGTNLAWDANLPDSSQIFREAYQLGGQLRQPAIGLGALANLAFNLLEQGQLREAESLCRTALAEYVDSKGRPLPILGIVYIPLASICYEQGNLNEAQELARRGNELCQRLFSSAIMGGDAEVVLARVTFDEGHADQAFELLESTAQLARQHNIQMMVFKMLVVQTELRLLQNDLVEAENHLNELQKLTQSSLLKSGQIVAHLQARYWVASGQVEKAILILNQLEQADRNENCHRRLIGVHLTQAQAFQKQGDDSQAAYYLKEALRMAAPEGYQSVFSPHKGRPTRRLLQAARALAPDFVDEVLKKSRPVGEPFPQLPDPLSEQEFRILKLMVEGKSNQEIADELVISVGTAKWHVHNILQKLGVKNRPQAIALAHEFGIA